MRVSYVDVEEEDGWVRESERQGNNSASYQCRQAGHVTDNRARGKFGAPHSQVAGYLPNLRLPPTTGSDTDTLGFSQCLQRDVGSGKWLQVES